MLMWLQKSWSDFNYLFYVLKISAKHKAMSVLKNLQTGELGQSIVIVSPSDLIYITY